VDELLIRSHSTKIHIEEHNIHYQERGGTATYTPKACSHSKPKDFVVDKCGRKITDGEALLAEICLDLLKFGGLFRLRPIHGYCG
jgi:hypothetical protein